MFKYGTNNNKNLKSAKNEIYITSSVQILDSFSLAVCCESFKNNFCVYSSINTSHIFCSRRDQFLFCKDDIYF